MVEVIQRRQAQPSYLFNQQMFFEVPGTVLSEDTSTSQENRQKYFALHRGRHTQQMQKMHYRVVLCAIKKKQGEVCYLR